ncbi:hypothetical protein SAMN05216288_0133 [Pseudomonas punonensis]|uniref:Uncharacterized protein n=1 Tax=Phytopseudomonas punonensis TaxID=1220495 RepID=A0A1M7MX66_9GAMM|nr:hypothetical protein SAMN05216288_0133 [Pseudomonas punonensis]
MVCRLCTGCERQRQLNHPETQRPLQSMTLQRPSRYLLVPAQVGVAHILIAEQLLAGAGHADFPSDHHVGAITQA